MGKSSWNFSTVTRVGLDLAKRVFQVHAVGAKGEIVVARKLTRSQLIPFFAEQPPCVVAMEACASAHHWGRALIELGHEVRLIPPAHVKPYVRRNKSDQGDVIRASGHFIGASWSVQFRWMQPLGNELRSGLQLSSNVRTAHAERLIASRAARTYDLAFLARCTLSTSAEPCATCAGAIYWAGIGRVVCGRARRRSKSRPARTLDLPCGLVSPPVNGRPLGPAA
jgi:deoxycytidylate deaminase